MLCSGHDEKLEILNFNRNFICEASETRQSNEGHNRPIRAERCHTDLKDTCGDFLFWLVLKPVSLSICFPLKSNLTSEQFVSVAPVTTTGSDVTVSWSTLWHHSVLKFTVTSLRPGREVKAPEGQQEEEDDLQVFSTSACKNVEGADDVTAPVKLKKTSLNLNPDEEETNFNTQTENPADPKNNKSWKESKFWAPSDVGCVSNVKLRPRPTPPPNTKTNCPPRWHHGFFYEISVSFQAPKCYKSELTRF